ncbi:Isoflavone reductase-like protein [Lachnellula subtilissima]|uniref:Isoflavone reductase-like protein n=1 Tax=Lachnellula subtilissima TaxID=602034 RepID=A0A8H8RYG6_9HELO|nr:Isoflavone reductase-like protein [Lachnellula subtilissima]
MSKPRTLVVGATGRTGGTIVDSLLEDGKTHIEALIRPASNAKPTILKLRDRGVKIHFAEIKDDPQLASILAGIDTVISTIGPGAQLEQIPLADAAKKADVKRFVPCAFITVCPSGGVMWIRDQQHFRKLGLPYTLIDVGYWYQASFPTLPSGRVDYASLLVPNMTISGDKNIKTALTDLRDIGPYVARCIIDSRTLNKYVFCYGELLSQDELFARMEELSGERIEREFVSPDQLFALCDATKASFRYDLSEIKQAMTVIDVEYSYSMFVRSDNSPEYAKYLGYLDARDLYPDFVPRLFEAFARELVDGKAAKIF